MWENLFPIQTLPPVRRIRGDRWYDDRGGHWVDFWKESGSWLFGHPSHGNRLEWKNQHDKGLSGLVPSAWLPRLKKHLTRLFPDVKSIFVFRNPDRALSFLSSAVKRELTYQDWASILWRPFLETSVSPSQSLEGWIWPALPSGPTQARVILATTSTPDIPENASDLVAPTDLCALTRAVVDISESQKLTKALESWTQVWKDWDRTAKDCAAFNELFIRNGPYLFSQLAPPAYEDLFRHFVNSGFLLSPDPSQPSILPQSLSYGELDRFKTAAQTFEQEE